MTHVLILGCGRSGTSIFGELFEALPGFTYASEPALDAIPDVGPGERLAVKVPRPDPEGDAPPGLPATVGELLRAMPEPLAVYWQVRHPLDAVASLRVGIDDGWNHHPRPPDWEDWLDRPLVERCAHHWAVINGAGYELVRDIAMVNRFEDMLRDPVSCARAAVRTVDVDPVASDEAVRAWSDRVQDTDNERFVEALTSRHLSRPDHTRRVERWRENLTPEDVASVRAITEAVAREFGYLFPE